ncbi:MAG: hypothetical protein ACRDTE_06985 [Pseudonocardiaceae bacterium]
MADPRVPLTERSLQFAGHMFRDMTRNRAVWTCRNEARKARNAAKTSTHPLLCLARAVWWDAVADHVDTDKATNVDRTRTHVVHSP